MKFVIVTGLSGAGKSMAVNALEDIGFFCIDNIPVALLPRIVDFALQGENQLNRVAVVMDVRGVPAASTPSPSAKSCPSPRPSPGSAACCSRCGHGRSMSSIPRCSAPPRTRSGCAACFWTTAKARWPSRWCPSVSSTDCPRRQTLCWMSDACPTRSTCRS